MYENAQRDGREYYVPCFSEESDRIRATEKRASDFGDGGAGGDRVSL